MIPAKAVLIPTEAALIPAKAVLIPAEAVLISTHAGLIPTEAAISRSPWINYWRAGSGHNQHKLAESVKALHLIEVP